MPSPSQFKKALKLENGCTLGTSGAVVTKSRIGHETKRTAALYHFPSVLSISWPQQMPLSDIKRRLAGDLVDLKKRECIAHSAYGSPYTCSIARAKVVKLHCRDKAATVELLGVAKRRKDLPKLRAGLDGEDSAKEKTILEHNGMRVIKSRFATSSCPLCSERILPGSRIAKKSRDSKRGGWVHAACAMKTIKPS